MRDKVLPLEIVEVNYWFPSENAYKPHPVLVVSTQELFEDEEMFYGLLMTTKNIFPKYTIKIESSWLTKPSKKESYFATHFLEPFTMNDVSLQTNNFLKPEYYDRIKAKMIQSIFYNG